MFPLLLQGAVMALQWEKPLWQANTTGEGIWVTHLCQCHHMSTHLSPSRDIMEMVSVQPLLEDILAIHTVHFLILVNIIGGRK
jgi:hypothetical protein